MNPRSSDSSACANKLKVLADQTRLAVVRQLFDGPCHVGQINRRLKLDQSLLSHHLKVLREAGIVVAQREGKGVVYRLAPTVEISELKNAINLGCCQLSFD